MINIPVVEDVFALRISAEYGRESGYIDRYGLAGSLAAGTATAGSLTTTWNQLGRQCRHQCERSLDDCSRLHVTPAILYQRTAAGDASTFIPAVGLYNTFNQVSASDTDSMLLPSLTIKKGLGFADLTSITSDLEPSRRAHLGRHELQLRGHRGVLPRHGRGTPYTDHQAENDNILGNTISPVTFTDHFNTWTQEFRLSSPAEQKRVKWVAGAFVADQEWSHLDYETAPGFSNSFQNIYGYNINTDPVLNPSVGTPPYNPNFWDNDLVWTVNDHNDVKQYAIFGQVDIDVAADVAPRRGRALCVGGGEILRDWRRIFRLRRRRDRGRAVHAVRPVLDVDPKVHPHL